MKMDSDEEFDQELQKPRLNMKHGFIHHIRRNQIDRDNYDKKVKLQPKRRGHSQTDKKPESKIYLPPSRADPCRKTDDSEEEKPDPSPKKVGKPLFKLEYTQTDGTIHSIVVKRHEDAGKLARRFSNQASVPTDLLETLEWKIQQEQIKRS